MRTFTAVVLLLALLASACAPAQPTGIVRDPAPYVGDLSLPDASGQPMALRAADNEYLLIYFGYLSCPDVCPTTMADLRSALGMIGEEAERVTVAMISIDPGRDAAEEVDKYVKVFLPNGIGLRTDDAETLRQVADAFGADYLVETNEDGEVEVGHTAYVYAVDSSGSMRLQWPFGALPEDIAHDIELLLKSS